MDFFRLRLVAALLLGITAISGVSTYFDVLARRHMLRSDLERRTEWYGSGIRWQLEQKLSGARQPDWSAELESLRTLPDQPALALYDLWGDRMGTAGQAAALEALPALPPQMLKNTLNTSKEARTFVRIPDGDGHSSLWFEDVMPLRNPQGAGGALVLLANADTIHAEGVRTWKQSFLLIAAMVLLIVGVTLAMFRWFLQRPVARATEWLQRLRRGDANVEDGASEFAYLMPLAREVTSLAEHLRKARDAAETEAKLRHRGENLWTADRLAVHVRERLGNGKLFVLSNREPYVHVRHGNEVECVVPPSGVVTALEPILQACDGIWIAHGSGNEDLHHVDEHDRLRVPPGDEHYTLRRVWLSQEEESGYYNGFANEGLWPLCHIAHTRPIFRAQDWQFYRDVNRRFADVLLEEMEDVEEPVVFVQDYHFALLPAMVHAERPDARVAIFWHIPWPNPEAFGICPWQTELLDGLLGADLIGFHLQAHCNNFMSTVDRVLEAKTDRANFSVRRRGHLTAVRPYPISVAWDHSRELVTRAILRGDLRSELAIQGKLMVLGVDRLDYTKGIPERLLAIEHLLEEHPWYREQVVFVQIAAPTRAAIPAYARLRREVESMVEQVNRRFQTSTWRPVILLEQQFDRDEVRRYYRAADVCLVTPLHDGMNLVAKEFLESRNDGDGVLVLSCFAGASQQLQDALVVNPYDIVQVSEAVHRALQMPIHERRVRMERMRQQVKEHNVYRWASEILTDLCAVRVSEEAVEAARARSQMQTA